MKKLGIATIFAVILALVVATGVFALVINGDFETGDFTGWTISTFINNGMSNPHGSGGTDLSVIVGGPAVTPLSFSDPHTNNVIKYPAYGHYSARVNSDQSYDLDGNGSGTIYGKNANVITQNIAAVLDTSDGLEHVRFTYAAAMVLPGPGATAHTDEQKPYFRVKVINTTNANDVIYDFQSYVGEPGKNWQDGPAFNANSDWKYIDWQYIDLTSSEAHLVNAGDNILIEITASGCSLGGHPGYVYVDEITDGNIVGPSINATGPATIYSGGTITYTYTYKNGSSAPILPTVTSTQPTGVTFTSVSDVVHCALNSGTVTCNFPSLAAGASGTFTISGTVTAPGGSQIAHGDYNIAATGFPTVGGQTVFTDVLTNSLTINQAGGQADPTTSGPIHFTAVFSQPVTGFDGTDVNLSASTAGGALIVGVTGGPTTYDVAVTGMTSPGNVIATIGANVTNEGNAASTSTDNTVAFVINTTINQAVGQADPTSASPVNFTAVFTSAVTDFTGADVTLSASTVSGTLSAVVTGGPTTYNVAVSGMTSSGDVIATIGSNVTVEGNAASTSTDNVVTFNNAVPEIQVLDATTDIPDGTGSVDFGKSLPGKNITKTFTVTNTGTGTLTLTEPITIPTGYTRTASFGSTSLAPGASTTFQVTLSAKAVGTYAGQITFGNNDADENPFNFAITGIMGPALEGSTALHDGWILESAKGSGLGGLMNSTESILRLGDNAVGAQYRSILSFKGRDVPANATITAVKLKIRFKTTLGVDPTTTHGPILVDIVEPTFGLFGLELTDFGAVPDKLAVTTVTKTGTDAYDYIAIIPPSAFQYISRTGYTQLRLRFTKPTDGDAVIDTLTFHSGDWLPAHDFIPILEITFTVP